MPRTSYSTMATPELDGVQAIRLAARYGLAGVDLRVSDIRGELRESSTDREILAVKSVFDSEGVRSASLFCYNQQASDEPESWALLERGVGRLLEMGNLLGTEIVRIQPGNPENSADPKGFLNRLADTLAAILSKDPGPVSIGIQNHVTMSPRALQIARLVSQAGTPRLGLVFCPTSSMIKGDRMDEVLAGIKTCTKQLYIADGYRNQDGKFVNVLPGQGSIPLRQAYQALGADAFTGWISLKYEKIWDDNLEDHTISLPAYIAFLKTLLGQD